MSDTKPILTLGQYKGLEVEKPDTTVTETDIEKELDSFQKLICERVEVEDEVINEDIVTIDFAGRVDGELFDGGTAESYELVVGTGTFIPGFEDQILGHKTGETFDVNVTFPEEYPSEELAGKPSVFEVTLKLVERVILPEITDEVVAEKTDCKTVEEYKAKLTEQIAAQKEEKAVEAVKNELVNTVIASTTVDIPEEMIDEEFEGMFRMFAQQVQQQGMDVDTYLQYTGMKKETMKENFRPQAEMQVKAKLIFDAIAEAEGLEATDADVDAEFKRMVEMFGVDEEQFRPMFDENAESLKKDLVMAKALNVIYEAAIIK